MSTCISKLWFTSDRRRRSRRPGRAAAALLALATFASGSTVVAQSFPAGGAGGRLGSGAPAIQAPAGGFAGAAQGAGSGFPGQLPGAGWAPGGVAAPAGPGLGWSRGIDPRQRAAAEAGDPVAQAALGYAFVSGESAPVDYAQAMHWFRAAALQGHAPAMVDVGVMHVNGEGVPVNAVEGFAWYLLAERSGDPQGRAYRQDLSYSLDQGSQQRGALRAAEIEREIANARAVRFSRGAESVPGQGPGRPGAPAGAMGPGTPGFPAAATGIPGSLPQGGPGAPPAGCFPTMPAPAASGGNPPRPPGGF